VVEARAASGSLVTARHAAAQGIDVLAVPGPIDAPTSWGTNRLLRDGAKLLLDVRDVFEAIGARVERAALPARGGDRSLSPLAATVLAALAEAPADRDALCRRLGRPPEALAAALLELELGERVAEDRDGRLRPLRDPFTGA
jgi:DNA processing protein